ncbi:putative transcription factor B3-Domain family [Helianthus anomalus]
MDPTNNSPSFLKLIKDDDPIFFGMSWLVNLGGNFTAKKFKGGASTLYVGDRFWNVKMDGLSDSCVFTHGWSELVNDLVLDRRSTFVFAMAGYKTFEVSLFNDQPGTEIQFKKVDLVNLSTVETDVEQGVVGDCEHDNIQLSTFECNTPKTRFINQTTLILKNE